MFSWLAGCRPHSSPDPFGATLPPGEGMDFSDKLKRQHSLPFFRPLTVPPGCGRMIC